MASGLPNLPTDALTAQHFAIEISGVEIAQFSEISGLAMEVEVIELKENTADGLPIIHKQPGAVKPPTLTLKRALNASRDLYDWHKAALDGRVGDEARAARAFGEALAEATGVPVEMFDERWTTIEAERSLRGTRTARKREAVDAVAATLLLRTWLAQDAARESH